MATKAFLTTQGAWTDHIQEAHHFAQTYDVEAALRRFGLAEVQLYYSFGNTQDSEYDFAVSL